MIRYRVVLYEGGKPFPGESGFEDRSFKTLKAVMRAIRKDIGYCKDTVEDLRLAENHKMEATMIRRYKQFVYHIVRVDQGDAGGVKLTDIWPVS